MSTERLTPTSYLVLGLLAREGRSTPYDLERHVQVTLGNFWSFPHTLLYTEPARLEGLGLVTETREQEGRRRRLFSITGRGLAELRAWLSRPSQDPPQLRDPGLLQLFFADLGTVDDRAALAATQLAFHRSKLAAYEDERRVEERPDRTAPRTVEHWRGVTLPMGILYERAAVEFWEGVAAGTQVEDVGPTAVSAE